MRLAEKIMQKPECLFTVIVICVDNNKGCVHRTFAGQNCLTGSPGFGSSFRNREAFRKLVKFLINIFHRYILGNPVSDDFFKFFFYRVPDNKNHFVKTGFFGIVNGVINDDFPVVIHFGKLFNPRSEATADSGCHND